MLDAKTQEEILDDLMDVHDELDRIYARLSALDCYEARDQIGDSQRYLNYAIEAMAQPEED